MARRSLLVAIAAIATAVAAALTGTTVIAATPGSTPTLASPAFANTVTINWVPSASEPPDSQAAWRAPGACGAIPNGAAAPVAVNGNSATDNGVPDGVYCYYVEADTPLNLLSPVAYSAGLQVTVDTLAPTAGIAPAFSAAPNYAHGTIAVALTSNDTGSGVASSSAHIAPVGTCVAGSPALTIPWNTTTVADGLWDVCNAVLDNAAHPALATATVMVDNALPTGAMGSPGAAAFVGGGAVILTAAGVADATAGVRQVQYQRSANGGAPWRAIPGVATDAGTAYQGTWNTQAAGNVGAGGDGPDFLRAVVTDNAGNVFNTPAIAVTVDNTAPDANAVLSAPPAVAGSPTLTWTPAHDAGSGIARYDVLRGATVIGTVASNGAQTYSFNDKNAPDQATSGYLVRAYDFTNHSIDSDGVTVLVDSKAQSAPVGLTAATPTAAAPALSWQAPPVFTVDHYDIYRDGVQIGSTTGAATTYGDATAAEGVHDYAVLARTASAQPGVLSSSFKVILDKTPPASGGAPTAQVLASGAVQLAWPAASDPLSGVAGYVVRRAAGGVPPAADAGSAVCTLTAAACVDAATSTGTWSYGIFAHDGAGNVALIGTVANVQIIDKTPPLAPTKLSLTKPKAKKKPGSTISYTLRWVKPDAPDLERVLVVLNLKRAPTTPTDGKAIYKGLGTSAKVTLRPGQTGYLALFAYDRSGNVSPKPARTVLKLASLIPLRPLNGSVVRSSTPMLTWKAAKGTSYYNVQVFLKGKRVLTGWPSRAAFRIPGGKLKPGTYVWYVWPAVTGKGSSPTFGKLIGRATFRYKK